MFDARWPLFVLTLAVSAGASGANRQPPEPAGWWCYAPGIVHLTGELRPGRRGTLQLWSGRERALGPYYVKRGAFRIAPPDRLRPQRFEVWGRPSGERRIALVYARPFRRGRACVDIGEGVAG